jgi:putative transposase
LFLDELIDRLMGQPQDRNAGSIPGESGVASQLKMLLAEGMLSAEPIHHIAKYQ